MFCSKCGTLIPDEANICPNCNTLKDGIKFCQHCGQAIDKTCIICPKCGKQVADINQGIPKQQPQIVINNTNTNANLNANMNVNTMYRRYGKPRNKWVAILLCVFLGVLGAHKFYENKIGMGLVYLFTGGLFIFGCIIDFIALLSKPTIYYV